MQECRTMSSTISKHLEAEEQHVAYQRNSMVHNRTDANKECKPPYHKAISLALALFDNNMNDKQLNESTAS